MDSYLPVSYANVYTSDKGEVQGTTTRENGQYRVDFSFNSLCFSHINYEKKEISKENLTDTVFLVSKAARLGEVIIESKEPE